MERIPYAAATALRTLCLQTADLPASAGADPADFIGQGGTEALAARAIAVV
ncbi:hypothetical protein T484DRAFT_1783299 [Baffinella frigidus]|nr:hypothetical protein T484DRAFT_1783299 [Cryptophyta sp. CCMP2293]